MSLRKRDIFIKENLNISNKCNDNKDESNSEVQLYQKFHKLTIFYWISLFIIGIVLFLLAVRLQLSCDLENDSFWNVKCLSKLENSNNLLDTTFNDSLARTHLKAISKLGNRPCGSTANEIHLPVYLINYLEKLKSQYSNKEYSNIKLTVEEQIGQLNSFPIEVIGNRITSVYDQIKNIVVRLHDTNIDNSQGAVLINCHYDSFFGGIGASDDLASCAVMLETIHAILKAQPISLKYDLIFLFNGAEENILQGAHAFVSQHRFAKDIRLFINLEAAGSGGRQMVFQTTLNHPWLIRELASVFQQPLATVIGQEIFSANLIPSDTDFRIFRDFRNIPGVDIAFITNGYVYHTKYDTEDRIPQSCLAHTGNNLLRLAVKLANSDNIPIYPQDDNFVHQSLSVLKSERFIYFDFLGLVLISYSEFTGMIFHFTLILVSLGLVLWRHSQSFGLDRDRYFKNLFHTVLVQFGWIFTNLIIGIILGYLVHRFGSKMSWYSVRYNAIGLYLVPLLWYYFVFHHFIARFLGVQFSSTHVAFEFHLDSSLVILAILTCFLTVLRMLSSYIFGIWLFFVVINFIAHKVLRNYSQNNYNSNCFFFLLDTFCLSLPFTYFCYLVHILFDVFIPIMGRSGPTYPDVVVSGLTALSMIIPGIIMSGKVYITTKTSKKWLTFILLHFSISFYIFLHSTHIGFPYNQSESAPRKQRIIINHVTRNIRNEIGQTRVSESGIWMISLDSNKLDLLKSQLQEVIHEPMQEVFCELRPYCGYPMLYPMARIIDNSLWLSQRPHQLKPSTSIIILGKVTHISGVVNITIQISGPSHTHLYLMTPQSMKIISWSLGPNPPEPVKIQSQSASNYHHYFIYYAYGKRPQQPLRLWIMFLPKSSYSTLLSDTPKDPADKQIEIALAAHYLLAKTSELESMLHLMPNWVVSTTLASTYEHLIVDFDKHMSYVQ